MDTETQQHINHLEQEIKDAHEILSKYGVGKEHWSLSGRIELVILLAKQQAETIKEVYAMLLDK